VKSPAPQLGEHREEILGGMLGYPPEKIRELEQSGAI
jgi:crotonobetainyl-CoA:carnitine CoA-transferase CaiB-like acyl-CoA transferase